MGSSPARVEVPEYPLVGRTSDGDPRREDSLDRRQARRRSARDEHRASSGLDREPDQGDPRAKLVADQSRRLAVHALDAPVHRDPVGRGARSRLPRVGDGDGQDEGAHRRDPRPRARRRDRRSRLLSRSPHLSGDRRRGLGSGGPEARRLRVRDLGEPKQASQEASRRRRGGVEERRAPQAPDVHRHELRIVHARRVAVPRMGGGEVVGPPRARRSPQARQPGSEDDAGNYEQDRAQSPQAGMPLRYADAERSARPLLAMPDPRPGDLRDHENQVPRPLRDPRLLRRGGRHQPQGGTRRPLLARGASRRQAEGPRPPAGRRHVEEIHALRQRPSDLRRA